MTQYTTLTQALNYIPRSYIEKYGTDKLIGLMYDAYQRLNFPQKHILTCEIVPIENNTVQLNSNWSHIYNIFYLKDYNENDCTMSEVNDCFYCEKLSMTQEQIDELQSSCGAAEIITKHYSLGHTIHYRLFLESNFRKQHFTELCFLGRNTKSSCKHCTEETNYFAIDMSNVIRTDKQEGYAIVHYEYLPECSGDYQIVDDQDVFEFFRIHIMMRDFEEDIRKDYNTYSRINRKYNGLYNKIKGKFRLRNINSNLLYNTIIGDNLRQIHNPIVFNEHLK